MKKEILPFITHVFEKKRLHDQAPRALYELVANVLSRSGAMETPAKTGERISRIKDIPLQDGTIFIARAKDPVLYSEDPHADAMNVRAHTLYLEDPMHETRMVFPCGAFYPFLSWRLRVERFIVYQGYEFWNTIADAKTGGPIYAKSIAHFAKALTAKAQVAA